MKTQLGKKKLLNVFFFPKEKNFEKNDPPISGISLIFSVIKATKIKEITSFSSIPGRSE